MCNGICDYRAEYENKPPKPHVHADVIKAWADGAEVEHFSDGKWFIAAYPKWVETTQYRVKPEPKPMTDLEKYGVEVGDVWVTRGNPTRYMVWAMKVDGKRVSTATVGSRKYGTCDCMSLPLQSFEHDTLLFRRGVVNKL